MLFCIVIFYKYKTKKVQNFQRKSISFHLRKQIELNCLTIDLNIYIRLRNQHIQPLLIRRLQFECLHTKNIHILLTNTSEICTGNRLGIAFVGNFKDWFILFDDSSVHCEITVKAITSLD